MPRPLVVAVSMLATVAAAGGAGASAATGTLTGQTQISYGCPGPVAADGPSCHPWHAFANARFSVSPRSGQARTVVSDGQGGFTIRLAPGSYTVSPLAMAHTRGGTTLRVQIHAGAQARIVVRFQGFPMMA